MAVVPASAYGSAPTFPTGSAVAPPPPAGDVPKGTTLTGVLVLLVADAIVLATLIATWFTIKGGAPTWPPKGVHLQTYLPTIVTITAAMSAFSVQWAVSSIRRNDQRNATVALGLTVVLGLAIANAQWYSLVRARMGIHAHAYATLYYLLIGYHMVHVAIAIGALVLVGARTLAGHFGREGYDPMRAAAAFWQYTNFAWGVILIVVFLLSRHAHP